MICAGTFAFQKQRPAHSLATIHSKPVVYVNNGGGRDTYISNTSGGLRAEYRPAHGKRTFYSNLRQYDQIATVNRGASHTATAAEKRDLLSNTQNRFNDKFRKNNFAVKNYQNMLDQRLSKPKATQETENGKIFRNSASNLQALHQDNVFRRSAGSLSPLMKNSGGFESGYPAMDLNVASYTKMGKPRNTIAM